MRRFALALVAVTVLAGAACKKKENPVPPAAPAPAAPSGATTLLAEPPPIVIVASRRTKVFHASTCPDAKAIAAEDKQTFNGAAAARTAGFTPHECIK